MAMTFPHDSSVTNLAKVPPWPFMPDLYILERGANKKTLLRLAIHTKHAVFLSSKTGGMYRLAHLLKKYLPCHSIMSLFWCLQQFGVLVLPDMAKRIDTCVCCRPTFYLQKPQLLIYRNVSFLEYYTPFGNYSHFCIFDADKATNVSNRACLSLLLDPHANRNRHVRRNLG